MMEYIKTWFRDFIGIFNCELRSILHDSGVMLIFIVAGFLYPLLYNVVYSNGVLSDTPIAVVDLSNSSQSREYIRQMDATREVDIAYRCASMQEAKTLMQQRKVNGVVYFPEDFGDNIARNQTGKLSIYADMSSFLYYKNLLMSSEFVMLNRMHEIEISRYSALGMTAQEADQMVRAIPYDENNPYNRTFSYSIFLISAILLLIIQQVMFYGMSLRTGTMREENYSFTSFVDKYHGHGVGRVILGRGGAYWLIFMTIGLYIAAIVPAMFDFPQRGNFIDILVLLLFFVTDCVFFSLTWSSLITRRESVFVLLMFMSPICLFLTGFSWPETAFPAFWKYFSYLFPTTFGCRAFINLNTAGATLGMIDDLINSLALQTAAYFVLACIMVYLENFVLKKRNSIALAPKTENNILPSVD